jgi:predicted P-loop ATPase
MEWFQHQGFLIQSAECCNAAMEIVARDHSYHPVRSYLDSLKWDGKPRIDTWLTSYLGAERTDFNRAIGAKWLVSAVARVKKPGCKADHVLILESAQGGGKSTAISILGEPFYTDDMPELGTKDASQATAGMWIIELPELDAMNRADVSKIKAFISRSTDRFRPPYGRRPIVAPRQCVFAGSVNHAEYLKDDTGGRRFWPVLCGTFQIDALRRDKDQLWAEAVSRHGAGERWWLDTPELIAEAAEAQEARYSADPWESNYGCKTMSTSPQPMPFRDRFRNQPANGCVRTRYASASSIGASDGLRLADHHGSNERKRRRAGGVSTNAPSWRIYRPPNLTG